MLLERNKNVSNGCLTVTFYCFYTAIISLMKGLGLLPISASIARVKMSCEPFVFGREISVCLTHTVCVCRRQKLSLLRNCVWIPAPWSGALLMWFVLSGPLTVRLLRGFSWIRYEKYSDLMAVAIRDKSSLCFSAISVYIHLYCIHG